MTCHTDIWLFLARSDRDYEMRATKVRKTTNMFHLRSTVFDWSHPPFPQHQRNLYSPVEAQTSWVSEKTWRWMKKMSWSESISYEQCAWAPLFFVCLPFDYAWRLRYSASRPCVVFQGDAVIISRHQKMRGCQNGDGRCASRPIQTSLLDLVYWRVSCRLSFTFVLFCFFHPVFQPYYVSTDHRLQPKHSARRFHSAEKTSFQSPNDRARLSATRTYGHVNGSRIVAW